jgi:hypothetical protein
MHNLREVRKFSSRISLEPKCLILLHREKLSLPSKVHSFLKQCFSFYENKVFQLMQAGASLERFGEKTFFSYNEDCANTV